MSYSTRFSASLLVSGSAAALAFTIPATAFAQDTDAGNEANERRSNVIVVTAQRREESIQDVSASVTAFDEEALERAGITDPTRLGATVPGLVVGYSGNEARIAIRGARTNNVGAQAEQVVGIFEDGLYIASTTQAFGNYLDVARIEVLRGPQGTLYGRNTFAGTINIISNEPEFDAISGKVRAQVGNYSQVRAEGVLNLPVSDTFALRFAGLGEQHDGYIKNSFLEGPKDDLRDQNVKFGRVSAKWEPSDRFDAIARFSYMSRDVNGDAIWGYTQTGCYRNDLDPTTSTGNAATATYFSGHCYQPGSAGADPSRWTPDGAATTQDEGPYDIRRNSPARTKIDSWSANLQLRYDLGFADLKLLTAYNEFDNVQYYDVDYSDGNFDGFDDFNNGFAGYNGDQKNFSAELQLASSGSGPLEWLLGAYYFEQTDDWNFGFLSDGVYTPYYVNSDFFQSESRAIFGQASYSLTDKLRVIGGLRYAEDKKSNRFTSDADKWDKLLYKAGIEYDVNDDAMIYGIVSTGYRTGGVNGSGLVAAGAPPIYDPEAVTAYEMGLKSVLANGDLIFNAAAYYNKYSNMHAQSFVVACIDDNNPATCIASEFTENGGEIDAWGLEFEAQWFPADNAFVNATLAYNHSEFGDYNVGQVAGLGNLGGRQDVTQTVGELGGQGLPPGLSLKGWAPALQPRWTASIQAGYTFDLGGGNTLTPMVQTAFSSQYWSFDFNVPGTEQDSYTKSDLRLTWESENSGLSIQAFVQNLENEAVLTRTVIFGPSEAATPTASIQANYADPRTYGLAVGLKF
jgi:outer membrane receptor protein involved in Fe transport